MDLKQFLRKPSVAVLILCIIESLVVLCFSSNRKYERKKAALLRLKAHDIIQVVIEPRNIRTVANLSDTRITITDREVIARIPTLTRSAFNTSFQPNHPHAIWMAKLCFVTPADSYTFEIMQTNDARNGVVISFEPHTHCGPGEYHRADALGAALETYVKNQRTIETTGGAAH